jgi:hypothetical protein
MPNDHVAALIESEVGMRLALLEQRQTEIYEISRALRDIIDSVQNGLDPIDGHD